MKKFRTLLLLLSAAMLFAPLPSASAPAATAASAAATKFLRKALKQFGKITVLRTLPGPPGLTAALISTSGGKGIVWIVGNNVAVATGTVLDATGKDLTKQVAIRMGLVPKPLAPAAVAAAVTKLHTFTVGSKGPELTAFVDPNCIFCHRLYVEAQPLIRAGKLHLRVVLVGFLKPTSFAKAATILMSSDPAKALRQDETAFDTKHEEGGIKPAKAIPSAVKQAITANTRLLAHSGGEATPTLLYQTAPGDWHIMQGLPEHGLGPVLAQMKK